MSTNQASTSAVSPLTPASTMPTPAPPPVLQTPAPAPFLQTPAPPPVLQTPAPTTALQMVLGDFGSVDSHDGVPDGDSDPSDGSSDSLTQNQAPTDSNTDEEGTGGLEG